MFRNETNDPRYRAAELGALLARHYPEAPPHLVARVVFDMQRAAKAAVSWGVRCCNENMSEAQEERGRKRLDKLEADINGAFYHASLLERSTQVAHAAPARIELGGDGRGPCARLHIPGQRGDGWGEGFAVY